MQIFVKIGGYYFEISQFEKFVVTLVGGQRWAVVPGQCRDRVSKPRDNLDRDKNLWDSPGTKILRDKEGLTKCRGEKQKISVEPDSNQ